MPASLGHYGGTGGPSAPAGALPAAGRLPSAAQLRVILERFRGCLSALRGRLRRVVLLRSGLGARHPLSVRAVALRLRVSPRRVTAMESVAVRRVVAAARDHACTGGGASAPVTYAGYFSSISFAGSPSGAHRAGGLALEPAGTQVTGGPVPGTVRAAPPVLAGRSSSALVAMLAALAGLLFVAVLIADSLGADLASSIPGVAWLRRRRRRGPPPS